MSAKKSTQEPTTQMRVCFGNFGYQSELLLSAEDASLFMEILGRSNRLKTPYNEDMEFVNGVEELTFKPIQSKTVDELKKAAFVGISHTQYLEGLKDVKQGTGKG